MGISGLLPLCELCICSFVFGRKVLTLLLATETVQEASRPKHLRDYAGQTLAVDAFVLLHRGLVTCAQEVATGQKTLKYVSCQLNASLCLLPGTRMLMTCVFLLRSRTLWAGFTCSSSKFDERVDDSGRADNQWQLWHHALCRL